MRKFNKTLQNLQTILLQINDELQSFEITVTKVKKLGAPVVIDLERLHQLIQQVDTIQKQLSEISTVPLKQRS